MFANHRPKSDEGKSKGETKDLQNANKNTKNIMIDAQLQNWAPEARKDKNRDAQPRPHKK